MRTVAALRNEMSRSVAEQADRQDPELPGSLWGSGCIDQCFLELGTSLRWVVSFKSRPPYLRGKSPLYPLHRRLDGPQSRSQRVIELTGTRNSDSCPVQPVASRHTDRAFIVDRLMTNSEAFGRKRQWPKRGKIPTFEWRDWGKSAVTPAEIRTMHIPNISLHRYHYTNQFRNSVVKQTIHIKSELRRRKHKL
jgi:hypothetical protein